jgi:outer membrane protein OmpA-like peptidoglycan-associated protein
MKNLIICLLLLLAVKVSGQTVDTFEVRFALRETTINKKSAVYLDKLISKNKLAPGQKIMLLGYADFRGTAAHNDSVSADRATAIQQYLISKGFSKGDFTLCLGKGKIDRPGMTSLSGYAPDRKVQIIAPGGTTKMNINELKVNETVTLKSIFFEGGLPDIAQSSMPELENLLNFLQQNTRVTIQIEGHVCCKGISTVNEGPYSDDNKLSELRAKAICNYLSAKGINKNRMKYVGYGTSKPKVYPAKTTDEQQQNRRVEIRILSK